MTERALSQQSNGVTLYRVEGHRGGGRHRILRVFADHAEATHTAGLLTHAEKSPHSVTAISLGEGLLLLNDLLDATAETGTGPS